MDKKISKMKQYPNYNKIYEDLIEQKYPDREVSCKALLKKDVLSSLDVIKLNNLLFSNGLHRFNQKLRSYDESAILEILQYQKINKLSNTTVASHFKLSRNTLTKWKRLYNKL
jgi:hypothetical protein